MASSAPTSAPPDAPPPAPTGNGQAKTNAPKATLQHLTATFGPPRIILYGVEGWGKTSCGAFAPDAAMFMAKGESGYETLLGAGTVPNIPAVKLDSWPQTMDLLDELAEGDLPYKTLVFDALGGFERLCHEHVCARDFDNVWGERGFASYQKGYDIAVTDWLGLLARLDRLQAKGAAILLLGHSQVKPHKNPLGVDFDRYACSVHNKTWGVTHKWADAVLFGNYITIVDTEKPNSKRGKGIGGTDRILYTVRRDPYDAKNRYQMASEVEIPSDPKLIWSTIWNALRRKDG